jgi:hypothetical protein
MATDQNETQEMQTQPSQVTLVRKLCALGMLCVAILLITLAVLPPRDHRPFCIGVTVLAAAIGTLRGGTLGAVAWFLLSLLVAPIAMVLFRIAFPDGSQELLWIGLLFPCVCPAVLVVAAIYLASRL